MAITLKNYQCLVCGHTSKHSTNHFEKIYTRCKSCGNSSLSCMEPEALDAQKNVNTIKTKLNKYRFDVSKENERQQYNELRTKLKAQGLSVFAVWEMKNYKYFENLPAEIEIETDFVFDNQWNSNAGRVHDWYEAIYPNKKTKQGYWLELTGYHKQLRMPQDYHCIAFYDGMEIGNEVLQGINTTDVGNIMFSKYYKESEMDLLLYSCQCIKVN